MSCYVDRLRPFGWRIRGRKTESCHLLADTLDELHAMAAAIGLKRAWFQDKRSGKHYDLAPSKRAAAVALGAIELDDHGFIAKLKELRKTGAA